MTILVTGSAGFIGYHLAKRLLKDGQDVVGVDCLTPYYDVTLKQARLDKIKDHPMYTHHEFDLAEANQTLALFSQYRPAIVFHLAAQPGVRYSLENPRSYINNNIIAFMNILEGCRQISPLHLLFASSSSVYGLGKELPFKESDGGSHPKNLYAATKRSNELMAHAYAHLFDIPCTGLRLFTVYGPWGRPDMAPMIFAKKLLANEPIEVFNKGEMSRDFTYIDDVVEALVRLKTFPPEREGKPQQDSSPEAPFAIYNIGNQTPVKLMDFVASLGIVMGGTAEIKFLSMQPGDMKDTYSDNSKLFHKVGRWKFLSLQEGSAKFAAWFSSRHANFVSD